MNLFAFVLIATLVVVVALIVRHTVKLYQKYGLRYALETLIFWL